MNNSERHAEDPIGDLASVLEPASLYYNDALTINQYLQKSLSEIISDITKYLEVIHERFNNNERIITNRLKSHNRTEKEEQGEYAGVLRTGTICSRGNLHFRDSNGRSCPNNSDYEERCKSEIFPIDYDLRVKHVWSPPDIVIVLGGITQQLSDNVAKHDEQQKRKVKALTAKSLETLWAEKGEKFDFDWYQISSLDINCRYSRYSCEALWNILLKPKVNREDWDDEQNKRLLEVSKKYNMQNWEAIALEMDNRSEYDCCIHLKSNLRPKWKTKWTHEDDERLKETVLRSTFNNYTNWNQVMDYFPGRNRSSIIGRYIYKLHPSISHEPFTPLEDIRLCAAVKNCNGKFTHIERSIFPNRSLAQLRQRYYNVLRHNNKTDGWTVDDDKKLMDFVAKNGTNQWSQCAMDMGNRTRTSCRTRYVVIQRFLKKNPEIDLVDIPRRRCRKLAIVTPENWENLLVQWHQDPQAIPKRISKTGTEKKKRHCTKRANSGAVERSFADIYSYFLYGYNLSSKMSKQTKVSLLLTDSTTIGSIVNALQYEIPLIALKNDFIKNTFINSKLQRSYNKMFKQLSLDWNMTHTSELLPPSWSTLMGLRAVAFLSMSGNGDEPVNYDESAAAIQKFRHRLRVLFYRSKILTFYETTHFQTLANILKITPTLGAPSARMRQKRPPPTNKKKELELKRGQLSANELALLQLKDSDSLEHEGPQVIHDSNPRAPKLCEA